MKQIELCDSIIISAKSIIADAEELKEKEKKIREDEREKVIDEVLNEVALEEMWLSTAIHEDKGNYNYNIDMAFTRLKDDLQKLKEKKNS